MRVLYMARRLTASVRRQVPSVWIRMHVPAEATVIIGKIAVAFPIHDVLVVFIQDVTL
jgi:hypothetical protein